MKGSILGVIVVVHTLLYLSVLRVERSAARKASGLNNPQGTAGQTVNDSPLGAAGVGAGVPSGEGGAAGNC